MGKFDKEIKQAEKIGREWRQKSEDYQDQYQSIKKQNMKWEKDTVTKLQAEIKNNAHTNPDTAKGIAREVEVIQERIKDFRAEIDRLHKEHEKWALKEPRKSMASINDRLKLGGSKTEAYQAVSEATKKQLTDVATVLRTTQQAYKDVTYALDVMEERVKGIEKIVAEGKSKSSVWIGQIRKEAQMFVDNCDGVLREYGVQAQIFSDIRSGKKDDWDPRIVKQQHQLAVAKAKEGPRLMAQVDKNHKRILKSVPKEFLDGFMTSKEKTLMEKKREATLTTLRQRVKFWTQFVQAIKDRPALAQHL